MARTATGPNGEKLELREGEWVQISGPVGPPVPTEEQNQNKRPGLETFGRFLSRGNPFLKFLNPTGPIPWKNQEAQEQVDRTFVGTSIANILSIPNATGKLLAAGAAAPALIPGGRTFSEARADEEQRLPAAPFLAFPDVSTEQVLAVPGAIRKSLSDPMVNRRRLAGARFDEAVSEEGAKAEAQPIASTVGRTGADIASLLIGRPGRRLTELLPKSLNPRAGNLPEFPSRLSSDVKATLDAAAARLTRGTGRAVEAGFDGAVVSAIGDEDPIKTAAWTAGIQAGGSAALAAKSAFIRKPITSFATLWFGHQLYKWAAPGPQQAFESSDAATAEIGSAFVLGTLAAMAGASRGAGPGNMQRFVDAFSSASRAGIASVATQLQEAEANNQPQYARVLGLMSQDQERFGTDARVLLERAARSDKPRALLNQIDELMKSTRFRKALEEESESQPTQSFYDWLTREQK